MSSHFAGLIMPETITCVPTVDMVPLVFHLKGVDRTDLDLLPQGQGAAVYIGFYRTGPEITSAYVGFSTCVANRIVRGNHLSGAAEPDDLFIITAANGAMTPIIAQAGERIVYGTLKELTKIRLIGQTPHGAPVGPDHYDRLRIFFCTALLGIRHSGIALTQGCVRNLTMGPRTNVDKFGELRGNGIPDGDLYRLAKVGVAASAIENDGLWMVLAGSEIRVDVTSSAGGITRTRHEELLHSGILVPYRPGLYRLRRDMIFETASAAALFVAGSKGVNVNAWEFGSTYRNGRPVLRIVPS